MHTRTLTLTVALVVSACGRPPGRPVETPTETGDSTSGDVMGGGREGTETVANAVRSDVMCESISAMPGYTCADDSKRRGRQGDRCPNGEPMVESADAYAFPEAPVSAMEMPSTVHRTASGLGTCVVRRGTGAQKPRRTDRVQVHYLGWNDAQGVFDSSVSRNEPTSFPLDRVISGWTEGVAMMVEGEVRRFYIPEHLAYQGRLGSPGGMLLFDVELLAIGE